MTEEFSYKPLAEFEAYTEAILDACRNWLDKTLSDEDFLHQDNHLFSTCYGIAEDRQEFLTDEEEQHLERAYENFWNARILKEGIRQTILEGRARSDLVDPILRLLHLAGYLRQMGFEPPSRAHDLTDDYPPETPALRVFELG